MPEFIVTGYYTQSYYTRIEAETEDEAAEEAREEFRQLVESDLDNLDVIVRTVEEDDAFRALP